VLSEESVCWWCGEAAHVDDPLEVDHVVPRSKGGVTVRRLKGDGRLTRKPETRETHSRSETNEIKNGSEPNRPSKPLTRVSERRQVGDQSRRFGDLSDDIEPLVG
jgi:5-methylcytosine-specific restriction endonuclease McrA